MATGRDALGVGGAQWTEVAWECVRLLGRAFMIAVAVGLLLTAAGVVLR